MCVSLVISLIKYTTVANSQFATATFIGAENLMPFPIQHSTSNHRYNRGRMNLSKFHNSKPLLISRKIKSNWDLLELTVLKFYRQIRWSVTPFIKEHWIKKRENIIFLKFSALTKKKKSKRCIIITYNALFYLSSNYFLSRPISLCHTTTESLIKKLRCFVSRNTIE